MKIGITGARGRLAPLLLKHFQSQGAEVSLYSRVAEDGMLTLSELVQHPPQDVLIHCAWSTVPLTAETDPGSFDREDKPLLERIVHATAQHGTRIVFPSSGAVYGNTGDIPVTEDAPINPLGAYAQGKVAAEKFLLENAASRVFILRTTNLLGESGDPQKPQGILPRLVDAALKGTVVEIWGDGSATKDYIHCSDFVSGLEALLNSGSPGLWNIGSGTSYSLRQIIQLVEELTGKTIKLAHRHPFDWDVSHSKISVEKLRSTGWLPAKLLPAAVEAFLCRQDVLG